MAVLARHLQITELSGHNLGSNRGKVRSASSAISSADEEERETAKRSAEMVQFMITFTQKITIWGSDEVVKTYAAFKRKLTTPGELTMSREEMLMTMQYLFTYEDILFAIRVDIGHKNKGLVRGDLLSLFVNDIDKLLLIAGQSI